LGAGVSTSTRQLRWLARGSHRHNLRQVQNSPGGSQSRSPSPSKVARGKIRLPQRRGTCAQATAFL
jgi:hypothetical protein